MKLYLKYKKTLMSAFCIAALVLTGSASAALINGDFSDGLNGWGGDVIYFDGIDDVNAFDVNFVDFANNFSTGVNSVTLNTSTDGGNEYWAVYLFQKFLVDNNSALLSLEFDSVADDAYLTLVDVNGDLLHDFINDGLSVDISSWAGSFIALEMGIEDFDYVYDDFLTVSNISIAQQNVSVPEPSALMLFSLALVALRRKSIIRKRMF
jgi:hypothetical protein